MQRYDVIIAGGGPAGSTSATLLAQYGYRVLMLEQGQFPRFQIGESMMPRVAPIMDRLGVDWSVGNLQKTGADFIDEQSDRHVFFPLLGKYKTYQVDRQAFDHKLFNNAIVNGVTAHQLEKVTHVECYAGCVVIQTSKAAYKSRYLIDATGRRCLMGKKNKSVEKLDKLGRFALYQYYQLADNPAVEELFAIGILQILLVDIGWLWVIPLTGRRLSVGLVVQKNSMKSLKGQALYNQYISASPILTQLLKNSKPIINIQAEADFSYVNYRRYGQRFACCGDSGGFLDPIFSSGFFFAVKTAELVADRLHQGLSDGTENDPELQSADDAFFNQGFNTIYLMIERFYCSSLVDNLIFEFDRHERIKHEVIALLAGDLWNESNLFQQGMLKGRRRNLL